VAMAMVMTIYELLADPGRRIHAAYPEMDALTEDGALQEAQLVDVRFEALTSTASLLFDCRQAIQIRMANTAVVVMHGIRHLTWTGQRRGSRTAWNVIGSTPSVHEQYFSLELVFVPDAWFELQGEAGEFFVGDVPDLPDAPPNFGSDDDATIQAGMPSWGSPFMPEWATFLDPRGSETP